MCHKSITIIINQYVYNSGVDKVFSWLLSIKDRKTVEIDYTSTYIIKAKRSCLKHGCRNWRGLSWKNSRQYEKGKM
jgi:hypothetical protein